VKNSGGVGTHRVLLSHPSVEHLWDRKIEPGTEIEATVSAETVQLLPLHEPCCRRHSPAVLCRVQVTCTSGMLETQAGVGEEKHYKDGEGRWLLQNLSQKGKLGEFCFFNLVKQNPGEVVLVMEH